MSWRNYGFVAPFLSLALACTSPLAIPPGQRSSGGHGPADAGGDAGGDLSPILPMDGGQPGDLAGDDLSPILPMDAAAPPPDAAAPPAAADAARPPPDLAPDRPPPVDKAPPADAERDLKPDNPPPAEPPPARTCVDCGADCWPPLICVVADGAGELGRVPVAPFCAVAHGGTTVNGAGSWEVAGPDGSCLGFFGRVHATLCLHARPGQRYEQRERHYDLTTGELVSESGGEQVLVCP